MCFFNRKPAYEDNDSKDDLREVRKLTDVIAAEIMKAEGDFSIRSTELISMIVNSMDKIGRSGDVHLRDSVLKALIREKTFHINNRSLGLEM